MADKQKMREPSRLTRKQIYGDSGSITAQELYKEGDEESLLDLGLMDAAFFGQSHQLVR
jgi:hypothetical protein